MARPLRVEFPGALYHVTSRGNSGQKIFHDDNDRKIFLAIIREIIERYHFILHSYCLMDNHYHLVVETPEGNLSEGMRQINGIYTQKYNRRHEKTGHVFQGRYKAIIVDKDSYLLELVRYVCLNPVRANKVQDAQDWIWSSYRATAGIERAPAWLCVDWVLGQFSVTKRRAEKLFIVFVNAGMLQDSPWKNLRGQIFLGDTSFLSKLKPFTDAMIEIPRSQRFAGRPDLREIFADEILKRKPERNNAIMIAATFGYTLKEIADYLNIHYATVSRVLKKLREEIRAPR